MPCYSPLKGYVDQSTGGLTFRKEHGHTKMEVACGQCLGCRLDYSRVWAMRICHESSLYEYTRGNCFVTLTYRERYECDPDQLRNGYHVPGDWSLCKSHFQKFMKRLRKEYGEKIRYFHCGEYGQVCKHGLDLSVVECPVCRVGRPHYHAALFGISFGDLEPYGSASDGSLRYTSPTLERIWKYGFVDVGDLNFQTAAYMSRYILKKVNGARADDHYLSVGEDGELTWLQPEYVTMSRRPGIGRDWYEKYKDDCFPSDEVPVPGVGVLKKVPRYYEEILKHEDAMTHEQIKEMRRQFRLENAKEYTPERLMSKYRVKKAQTELLSRKL